MAFTAAISCGVRFMWDGQSKNSDPRTQIGVGDAKSLDPTAKKSGNFGELGSP